MWSSTTTSPPVAGDVPHNSTRWASIPSAKRECLRRPRQLRSGNLSKVSSEILFSRKHAKRQQSSDLCDVAGSNNVSFLPGSTFKSRFLNLESPLLRWRELALNWVNSTGFSVNSLSTPMCGRGASNTRTRTLSGPYREPIPTTVRLS